MKNLKNWSHFNEKKIEWFLTDANKYSLLSKSAEEGEEVTKEIDKLIKEFKIGYKKIYNKYPSSALGDTAVADAVHEELYDEIHIKL